MGNNETGEKRKLLNFFDIIIIAIVVVIVVVFLLWKAGTFSKTTDGESTETSTISYTLELTNMELNAAEAISPGDDLVDTVKKYKMGIVEDVKISPTQELVKDYETGRIILSDIPEKYTAVVKMTAEGTETDSALTVAGGYEVRAGISVTARGPGYYGSGMILSVERGAEQ